MSIAKKKVIKVVGKKKVVYHKFIEMMEDVLPIVRVNSTFRLDRKEPVCRPHFEILMMMEIWILFKSMILDLGLA